MNNVVSIAFGSALIGVPKEKEKLIYIESLNRLWFGSDWGPE